MRQDSLYETELFIWETGIFIWDRTLYMGQDSLYETELFIWDRTLLCIWERNLIWDRTIGDRTLIVFKEKKRKKYHPGFGWEDDVIMHAPITIQPILDQDP